MEIRREREDSRQEEETSPIIEKKPVVYISFTELYTMKQTGLEKLVLEHEVYLLSKRIPPIKLSLAELN